MLWKAEVSRNFDDEKVYSYRSTKVRPALTAMLFRVYETVLQTP